MSTNFGNNQGTTLTGGFPKDLSKLSMLAAAIIVPAILIYLFFNSDSATEANNQMLSIGQNVTLENPNGGLSHMTAGPGMMSASVSEEDREQSICTVQPGTHGTIEEQQVIDLLSYVKVKLTDGDCEGKSGWITRTNIKSSL